MRRLAPFIFALAGISLVLWYVIADNTPSTEADAALTAVAQDAHVVPSSPGPSVLRPLPRLLMAPAAPTAQSESIEFDRRPFDPAREAERQYNDRMKYIAAFEAFRRESGVSDAVAQEILRLLYEYQEIAKHMSKELFEWDKYGERSDGEWNYHSRRVRHAQHLMKQHVYDRIEELLSDHELRAWRRTMKHVHIFPALDWPYDPPILIDTVARSP